MRVTRTPPPPLPTSWLPVRLTVSSSDTPRITRGIDATTLPLVGSSSLAMWCLLSLPSPFPPPPLPLPPRSLTSPLCFPLTRWSSYLCSCFMQVLLRRALRRGRAPASRSPMTPLALLPARTSRGHLPGRPPFLRPTRDPGRRLRPHRHTSPSRCSSTNNVLSRRRCLCCHRWPLLRRGHLCHRRLLLRRRHRHRRRGPRLLVSRRRCTTHRSFTDTRVMFTLR